MDSKLDKCSFCGMMELHIHIDYETDNELTEYLDSCGTEEIHNGVVKKIIYTKVPAGQGTGSQLDAMIGPLLDAMCDIDFEELENQQDTEA